MCGFDVLALGRTIVKDGWLLKATSHAVCVEDDPKERLSAKWTAECVKNTTGLARLPDGVVRYGSLSCTHTNQFLVSVLKAVHAPGFAELTDAEGRLSRAKLGSADNQLDKALENGIRWLVIDADVPTLYPSLCRYVQCARNATGFAQRKETEFHALLQLQQAAEVQLRQRVTHVDFSTVLMQLSHRTNFKSHELQTLCKYVQLYGGGESGTFIRDLMEFARSSMTAERTVPIATFRALTSLQLGPEELCPHVMAATIKAQGSCPPRWVANGFCQFISAADIASLANNKKGDLLRSQELLAKAKTILGSMDVSDEKRHNVFRSWRSS